MVTALIHMKPEQKKRMVRRTRRKGVSFSEEVRNAMDFYLDLPENTEELEQLAKDARQATESMIQKLDEALAVTDRTLRRWGQR